MEIARSSVAHAARSGAPLHIELSEEPRELCGEGASFVTLRRRGELRGCIGMVEATRPLAVDIAHNAASAALSDPRFQRVAPDELPELDVSVSVLSAMEPLEVRSRAELVAALVPGRDGLLLVDGRRRGLLLPQVWESLPDRGEFVNAVLRKAGLPAGHWSPSMKAFRFRADEIRSTRAV